MTDDQEAERTEIRDWFRAERARVDAVPDDQWTAQRDDEARTIREWAAARRRNAA